GWSIQFVPSHNQADRTFNNDPVIERIVKLLNERPLSLRGDCGLKKLLDDDFEGTDRGPITPVPRVRILGICVEAADRPRMHADRHAKNCPHSLAVQFARQLRPTLVGADVYALDDARVDGSIDTGAFPRLLLSLLEHTSALIA